eukprot:366211-Chlamydomonas_euryale.AAC.7
MQPFVLGPDRLPWAGQAALGRIGSDPGPDRLPGAGQALTWGRTGCLGPDRLPGGCLGPDRLPGAGQALSWGRTKGWHVKRYWKTSRCPPSPSTRRSCACISFLAVTSQ